MYNEKPTKPVITPEWKECFKALSDPTVSEIETNGKDSFFMKQSGKRKKLPINLGNDKEYVDGIRSSLVPFVRNFNEWNPVDGYIFEGPLRIKVDGVDIRGRTHIVLSPAADSPQITIAKKSTSLVTLDSIAERGSMSTEMMQFLKLMVKGRRTMVLSGGTGAGKSLTHDTKIITPTGYTTMGRIEVGDKIYGRNGEIGTVLKKFPQPERKVFEVVFNTGEKVECDLEHNWLVSVDGNENEVRTTKEIMEFLEAKRSVIVPSLNKPVEYDDSLDPDEYVLHPYVLGLQLSVGSIQESVLYCDDTVANRLSVVFKRIGLDYSLNKLDEGIWKLLYDSNAPLNRRNIPDDLEESVFKHIGKEIPMNYLTGSPETRMMILAGLLDAQSPENKTNTYSYETYNSVFFQQIHSLVSSLGIVVTKVSEQDGKHRIEFVSNVALTCLNNDEVLAKSSGFLFREIVEVVDSVKPDQVMSCITVDTLDSTYLVGDGFIPTHNTTMLESLAKFIPMDTRIGIAEDTPELQLPHENASYLHSVPWSPGMDPNKVATLDWCVAQFNRMRCDMLVIGETRGKEFASFLTAANSGMEGCMTTIHANDAQMCLKKMTNFAQKGSEGVSTRGVNTDIANAIDLIIQLIILSDGRHKVDSITEVTRIISNDESAQITTSTLYEYDRISDKFRKVSQPSDGFRRDLLERGIDIIELCKAPIGGLQPPHGSSGKSSQTNTPPAENNPAARTIGLPTGNPMNRNRKI